MWNVWYRFSRCDVNVMNSSTFTTDTHILQITVKSCVSTRRAGNRFRSAFPQHKAASHDSFRQTDSTRRARQRTLFGAGELRSWGPDIEEQVSYWKAELASLSWRMLVRSWCRFCPQFGFRSPGTVSTKTNAPCHFPHRWAIFPFQSKPSDNKQRSVTPHPLHSFLISSYVM